MTTWTCRRCGNTIVPDADGDWFEPDLYERTGENASGYVCGIDGHDEDHEPELPEARP